MRARPLSLGGRHSSKLGLGLFIHPPLDQANSIQSASAMCGCCSTDSVNFRLLNLETSFLSDLPDIIWISEIIVKADFVDGLD